MYAIRNALSTSAEEPTDYLDTTNWEQAHDSVSL